MKITGKMLSPKEYAALGGVSVKSVYEACESGELPHVRPTGKPRGAIRISEDLLRPESDFQQKIGLVGRP